MQGLIDKLSKIEDKSKMVMYEYDGPDTLSYKYVQIIDDFPNGVVLLRENTND